MKNAILYILPALLVIMVIASCKKEGPDTPFGEIQGVWKLNAIATDDNGNGTLTPKPVNPEENDEFTFNSKGTGVGTYIYNGNTEPAQSFTWGLIDNDSLVMEYASNDTITYYISLLNSSSLNLIENTPQGLVGLYFTKK